MKEDKPSDINKRFNAALNYLKDQHPRGIQAIISRKTNVNEAYLSQIVNGKSPSNEAAEAISGFFGYTYEEMLIMGKWLISGNNEKLVDKFFNQEQIKSFRAISDLSDGQKEAYREELMAKETWEGIKSYVSDSEGRLTFDEISSIIGSKFPETVKDYSFEHFRLSEDQLDKVCDYLGADHWDILSKGRTAMNSVPYSTFLLAYASYFAPEDFIKMAGILEESDPDLAMDTILSPMQIVMDKDIIPEERVKAHLVQLRNIELKSRAEPLMLPQHEDTDSATRNNYMTQTDITPSNQRDATNMDLTRAEATLIHMIRWKERDEAFIERLVKIVMEPDTSK